MGYAPNQYSAHNFYVGRRVRRTFKDRRIDVTGTIVHVPSPKDPKNYYVLSDKGNTHEFSKDAYSGEIEFDVPFTDKSSYYKADLSSPPATPKPKSVAGHFTI